MGLGNFEALTFIQGRITMNPFYYNPNQNPGDLFYHFSCKEVESLNEVINRVASSSTKSRRSNARRRQADIFMEPATWENTPSNKFLAIEKRRASRRDLPSRRSADMASSA